VFYVVGLKSCRKSVSYEIKWLCPNSYLRLSNYVWCVSGRSQRFITYLNKGNIISQWEARFRELFINRLDARGAPKVQPSPREANNCVIESGSPFGPSSIFPPVMSIYPFIFFMLIQFVCLVSRSVNEPWIM